jgi:CDGSH-type Zn-finger protein
MTDSKALPVVGFHKDGPIRVEGLRKFLNSRGEAIAAKKVISLCRCGKSRNKPFCDGTHASTGFTDETSPGRVADKLDVYNGKELTIRDNLGICSHAAYCSNELPKAWRTGVEPWIDPDGRSAQDVIRIIRKCPSGALSYEQDGKIEDTYSDTPEIRITRNGPYQVRGGVKIEGADRAEGTNLEHCALCRCGA